MKFSHIIWTVQSFYSIRFQIIEKFLHLHSWPHFGEEHLWQGKWQPGQSCWRQSQWSLPVAMCTPTSSNTCFDFGCTNRLFNLRFSLSLCSGLKLPKNLLTSSSFLVIGAFLVLWKIKNLSNYFIFTMY